MAPNKPNTKRNRTLLILLGILLAFLLSLNVSKLYNAGNLSSPSDSVGTTVVQKDLNAKVRKSGTKLVMTLSKKLTTLK